MKLELACSLAAACLSLPLAAAANDMKGMDMPAKAAPAQAARYKAAGTVSRVDAKAGTVTIAHGPVESLNWPSMTMAFKAKDKAMLGRVKAGDKVDFTFTQLGKDYVVTEID